MLTLTVDPEILLFPLDLLLLLPFSTIPGGILNAPIRGRLTVEVLLAGEAGKGDVSVLHLCKGWHQKLHSSAR